MFDKDKEKRQIFFVLLEPSFLSSNWQHLSGRRTNTMALSL